MQDEAVADRAKGSPGDFQITRIEVEADQLAAGRDGLEQFDRVPAQTNSAVDDDLPGPRTQSAKNLVEQDGDVSRVRRAHRKVNEFARSPEISRVTDGSSAGNLQRPRWPRPPKRGPSRCGPM